MYSNAHIETSYAQSLKLLTHCRNIFTDTRSAEAPVLEALWREYLVSPTWVHYIVFVKLNLPILRGIFAQPYTILPSFTSSR
jgi:hypothetical protein